MRAGNFAGFLLANLLVALLVGYLLDSWFHTRPIFIIAAVLYAVIGSFIILIYRDRRKNG